MADVEEPELLHVVIDGFGRFLTAVMLVILLLALVQMSGGECSSLPPLPVFDEAPMQKPLQGDEGDDQPNDGWKGSVIAEGGRGLSRKESGGVGVSDGWIKQCEVV